MTLDQLRIFLAVAEREHVTRAAEALNLTQSAVSGAIAALEAAHRVKLFHRVGRGIALSETGRNFIGIARDLLTRAEAAERALSESDTLTGGRLGIVASQTIAGYWLPPLLADYKRAYPGIEVELAIGNSQEAADAVRAGDAELGFVEGPVSDPHLARWPIARDEMVLVSSEPNSEAIDADWLRRATWVARESGSGTRSALEEMFGRMGIASGEISYAMVLPSNEAVRTAVEHGCGVALLPALVVGPSLAAGKLRAQSLASVPRPLFCLRHRERYRSKAADALLERIRR